MNRILFLEPFYGGSHKDFADGVLLYSSFSIELATMPDRFWKWRMRGAALHFINSIPEPSEYSLIITSNLLSASDLKSFWHRDCPPILVYYHENQLSYPLPPGEKMDYHFGFTDITTALAGTALLFNSNFHKDSFFQILPHFLRKMPEYKPMWVIDEIKEKTSVLYPGCHYSSQKLKDKTPHSRRFAKNYPLIVWNHRWEFDKNPEGFFRVLKNVKRKGYKFFLVLMGENFQVMPKAFIEAKSFFSEEILQYGFVEDRKEYYEWLEASDIVISTSNQENFGIAILEAVRFSCFPLLPNRLSYPELIPKEFHSICLYEDDPDLENRLASILPLSAEESLPPWVRDSSRHLADYVRHFAWENRIAFFDMVFHNLLSGNNRL